jgi:hypothetical protein
MNGQRRKYTAEFKARVVLDMLTGQKSASQASREYGIKDSVLSRWKQEFVERSPMVFEEGLVGRMNATDGSPSWKAWLDGWRWNWIWQKKYRGTWTRAGAETGVGSHV